MSAARPVRAAARATKSASKPRTVGSGRSVHAVHGESDGTPAPAPKSTTSSSGRLAEVAAEEAADVEEAEVAAEEAEVAAKLEVAATEVEAEAEAAA
eukprot:scaffold4180_cov36-Phaeocystis_antarctica.AAC.3